ncbi:SNF2 family N-terminal domain-domain-containing protein [Protomyces lactucae-debilis]|uniref:DNA helicase n=1 Tax=Protomyces lactucae-debilis TaxID=2754530 RepID=A0A1Y2EYA8_PROLT|nr:SNF2 family N-terminal domain-containing protein [Protomyces lactucae-debilis]ORY75775.1 SNF2 family N-terminal domain-domain-containing protein [Protomyces lactucae-debilis]
MSDIALATSATQSPPVKRGPGRPRKIRPEDDHVGSSKTVEKKVKLERASMLSKSTSKTLKDPNAKPRGRPRKETLVKSEEALATTSTANVQPSPGIKRFRLKVNPVIAGPLITHPFHMPLPPKYASLDAYLASFISLDEDVTPEVAQQKRADMTQLRQQPVVPPSHQDILSNQACYFAKLMQDERRRNLSNARKIAGMVQQHFKRISGADERLEKDLLKLQRGLAKKTASEVRRKWRLAGKEVQRRVLVKEQEQQRALGKQHLNQILEHSTSLLDARRKLHDDEEAEESSEAESDDEDHYLSVEQLREKYAHIPEVEPALDAKLAKQAVVQEEQESPMDSEMDSDTQEAEDDGPGLSSLYPELRKVDRASSSADAAEIDSTVPIRPATRQSSGELMELASDVDMVEDDDSSPMDSEMDDDESGSEVSGASSGPGLAYLYSMPVKPKAQIEEVPAKPVEVQEAVPAAVPKAASPAEGQVEIKTPIPFLLRGTLREYQHIGLDWMAGLYQNGTNGILADEMGLGKTIQTISLLTWLACEREVWGPHLIIVPTSVMLNWEREFKKFAPGLKVLTYYGNPKERKEKRRGWSKPDSFHVIITSYQLVISDQATFRRRRWEYMILDEAHNIKNFKSQRWQTLLNFNTAHRLLLTGTPLQNNLGELWSLLYFLMPRGISEDASFANLSDFQEWFGRPVDKMIEDNTGGGMSDEARNTVAKLHRILRPYILRRLKADVEKQMPGKFEHVIDCRLSKRQRFLYDDFMSRAKTRETLASGNFLSIINCFMQLRKVCNHPDLFESRPIVTSFAMHKSASATYETRELLVRRRLLTEAPGTLVDLDFLNLRLPSHVPDLVEVVDDDHLTVAGKQAFLRYKDQLFARDRALYRQRVNNFRTQRVPIYGTDLLPPPGFDKAYWQQTSHMSKLMPSYESVVASCEPAVRKFGCITPKRMLPLTAAQQTELRHGIRDAAHFSRTCMSIAFPDKRLLQFDCGKLQRLDMLLRDLLPQGHRVLIFTQMTRMLDILEQFLNIHGHRYFRLDGATKIEQRQQLTERFNNDPRIPVFILSTRSGGLGINLTGANVVIFFDSDWNPCMDRQCQDRAHRIGQTRDVHIYRFVSEHTIEQNIMRKANQKRMLDNVVIGQGDFTTDFFNKVDWRDMLGEELGETLPMNAEMDVSGGGLEATLAMVEDEDDAAAARVAEREMDIDAVEFAETGTPAQQAALASSTNAAPVVADEGDEEEPGSVDDYMIEFLLREQGRMDLMDVV